MVAFNWRESLTNLVSFAVVTAAISSSLGRVICFSGATRPLAITKLNVLLFDRKATAPYALVLASATTCNCKELLAEVLSGKNCLFIEIWVDLQISPSMAVHSSRMSWSKGSSHTTCRCHSSCMSNLAHTDTGLKIPRGSKSLEDAWSTSRLVVSGVVVWLSPFTDYLHTD